MLVCTDPLLLIPLSYNDESVKSMALRSLKYPVEHAISSMGTKLEPQISESISVVYTLRSMTKRF